MFGSFTAIYYNGDKFTKAHNWRIFMTKPKPEGEKVYRGKQSYLTEEQIKMLKGNPNIVKVTDRQIHYTQTLPFILDLFISSNHNHYFRSGIISRKKQRIISSNFKKIQ